MIKKILISFLCFLLIISNININVFANEISFYSNDTTDVVFNNSKKLEKVDNLIGHYQFNITAGSSYNAKAGQYSHVSSMKQYEVNHSSTMFGNSSGGYLSGEYNKNGTIYKAYLVLESSSDGSYNTTTQSYDDMNGLQNYPVTLVGEKSILTTKVDHYNYIKKNIRRVGYIDITQFIKENGYGWYYVCNVPYDKTNHKSGGDVFADWKIIVIEENPNIPIRLLSLSIGCVPASKNGTSMTVNGDGIQTALDGNITGQLLYSIAGADPTPSTQKNWVQYGCSKDLIVDTSNFKDILTTSGIRSQKNPLVFIYSRNGIPLSSMGYTKSEYTKYPYFIPETCSYVKEQPTSGNYYLVDAADLELIDVDGNSNYHNVIFDNSAKSVSLSFKVDGCSLIGDILGISVDVDVPTFNSGPENYQITTLQNDSNNLTIGATIEGKITNTTKNEDVGITNNELILTIDKGLDIQDYNVKIYKNKLDTIGTTLTNAIYDSINNTLTFNNVDIGQKDSYIIYSINCKRNDFPRSEIFNSSKISGYYTNNGIITNIYIDGVAYNTSNAYPNYKVTINPNGGIWNNSTNNSSFSMTSKTSKTIDEPFRDSYNFESWEIEETHTLLNNNILYMDDKSINLIANWKPINYTITYDLNGGVVDNITSYNIETETFTLNNPTKVGYDFIGWTTNDNSNPQLNITIEKGSSGDKTYIANWKPVNYTITYNLDGGIANNVTSYNIETNTFTLNNPTKNGYTFIGWTGSNGSTKQPNISIDKGSIGNKSYNANYEIINYTITYDLNGGIANNKTSYNVETNTFILNNPTKIGYDFIGWSTNDSSTLHTNVTIKKGSIGNKTYIANWKPINYTITYNLDGGSASNPSSYNIETNTFTLNNPTKNGYTFIGWTGSNGSTKQPNISIDKGSIGNKSYNANYTINQYDVTYIDVIDNINGTQLGKTTRKVNYNSNVKGSDIGSSTSNNAYYNGYSYVYDTNAIVTTNGATVYRIFKSITLDKTFYLEWHDNNNENNFRPSKYTLKLMRNGALFKQLELSSSQISYTFYNLNRYDENNKEYNYTFQVDINSDRYKTSTNNKNTIIGDYQNSTFSVIIPKTITLNGNTGKGSYNIKVNGTFYYNDTLTITPNNSFLMIDKNNILKLQANVTQNTTSFNKNNLGNVNGFINLNKNGLAGTYNGIFNFNIKFVMKN